MSGAASSSELASALPESTTAVRSDPAAELAVIAGALGRMAQAARDDRAALERLRHMLGEMTEVIAQAKALPAEMNVLLDEFEHRVDAMMEAAGGMPAGAPPAEASAPPAEAVAPAIETIAPAAEAPVPAGEADQVPTVSGVVSDLRPDEPAPESAVPQAEQTATDKGPTVAMLTAMVQALRESIVELPPEPEPIAEAASPATPTVETIDIESLIALDALPETVAHVAEGAPAPVTEPLSDFVAAFSEQPEAESPIESLLAAEPAMETPAAAPPPVFDIHETALLESLEQMEARPIPPPDEGTAVIFTRQPEVDESPLVEQELGPEPQSETAALSDAGPATAEPETIAAQQFEPALAQQEPVPPEPTTAAGMLDDLQPNADVDAPQATAVMVTHTEDADNSADPDFDPTDFLFGPEPEPDPAAFLLDPEPATTTKPAVSLYQEIIAKPSARPTAKPDEAHASSEDAPAEPEPAPAPHDPLHALKAMSESEKIALFT